jgi:hypothetical protein
MSNNFFKRNVQNASSIYKHLAGLKAAADGEGNWWESAITVGWDNIRPGGNNTRWLNLSYAPPNGTSSQLIMQFNNETNAASITPKDPSAARIYASEMAKKFNKPIDNKVAEGRGTVKANITIRKYNKKVEMVDDVITTVLTDADMSMFHAAIALVGEAVVEETKARVNLGTKYVAYLVAAGGSSDDGTKAKGKKAAASAVAKPDIATLVATFTKDNPEFSKKNSAIITFEQNGTIATIVKACGGTAGAANTPAVLVVNSCKPIHPCRETYTDKVTNEIITIANPTCRLTIGMIKDSDVYEKVYDASKPLPLEDGKPRYEQVTVNGVPLSENNVHEFIKYGCSVSGIVRISAVCISMAGISIPLKTEVLTVGASKGDQEGLGLDDFIPEEEVPGTGGDMSAVAAPKAAAPKVAAKVVAEVEDDDEIA